MEQMPGRKKARTKKKFGYNSPFSHEDDDDNDRKVDLPDRFRSSSSSDSFRRSGDWVYASGSRIGSSSRDDEYRIRGNKLISTSDSTAKYRIHGDRLYKI